MSQNERGIFGRIKKVAQNDTDRTFYKNIIKDLARTIEIIKSEKEYREGNSFGVTIESFLETFWKIDFLQNSINGDMVSRTARKHVEFLKNPEAVYNRFAEMVEKMSANAPKPSGGDIQLNATMRREMPSNQIPIPSEELSMEENFIIEVVGKIAEHRRETFISLYKKLSKEALISEIEAYGNEYIKYLSKIASRQKRNAIIDLMEKIKQYGALGELRKSYNSLMWRMDLNPFAIPENIDAVDGDNNFFGFDLSKLTDLEVEIIKAFYVNRVEKLRENISESVFILSALCPLKDMKKVKDIQIKRDAKNKDKYGQPGYVLVYKDVEEKIYEVPLNHEMLKEVIYPYHIASKLIFDMAEVEIVPFVKKAGLNQKIASAKLDDEVLVEKYGTLFFDECKRDLNDVVDLLVKIGVVLTKLNYKHKDVMIEEIITSVKKLNINWGIIEDGKNDRNSPYILLGFDMPGLNMPARLHFPREKLIEALKNMGDTKLPLYVGAQDLQDYETNISTPLLLPTTPSQRNYIKSNVKARKKESYLYDMVRHMACTQLPNPIKKLTGGKSKHAQYIDMLTGEEIGGAKKQEHD